MNEQELPFEEKSFNEEEARFKRIKDILEQESLLKKERQKLYVEKPWYRKPEILITVFGIIFPIIVSYLISASNKDKKELSITYSSLEEIISESDKFGGNLVINYDSSQVNNISKLTLRIKNSGNLSLSKPDFLDGPLNFVIKYSNNTHSSIIQVNKVDDAKQQNSELTFYNNNGSSTIRYLPSLLNKGDEVTIEAYFLNSPSTNINLNGKLLDGDIIGPKPINNKETKIGYKSFVISLNSFFSFKWVTVCILIILFIFTALSSLFQFSMASEGEVDPPGLIIFMGVVTSLISIFFIILIVSVLIYV